MRTIACLFILLLAPALAVPALAVPPGATARFDGGAMGPVTFDGAFHADQGLSCPDCHTGLFEQARTARITLADHEGGRFCSACHDGTRAFAAIGNCDRCHARPGGQPAAVPGKKWNATCLRCHGGSPQVAAISRTKHGVGADARTPDCTDCHGPSADHVTSQGATGPDRLFDPRAATPVTARNEACLACHKGGARMHWSSGAHATRDVACTACHQVHAEHDKVRERVTQADVCFRCHKEQRAMLLRPSHHPIREGKVVCSDCHNPHGSITPRMLARDTVNDTCYTCHMEKRGPFVRTHQPVQEDCSICHNPHGSVNANLLRLRPPWLCQQCHEPTSHRGAPGSNTLTGSHANTLARGCPNCHTNIHGTNNPSDLGTERSLRR